MVLAAAIVCAGACGKRGNPLPPLRPVPGPVTEAGARRLGDAVYLRFTLPSANLNAPGPADIGQVEVYALTIDASAPALDTAGFVKVATRIATVPVKPGVAPGPGEVASVVEPLGPEKLQVWKEPAAEAASGDASRVYLIRAVSRKRQNGPPVRATVSLAPAPLPPTAGRADYTERAIVLEWLPPVSDIAVDGYNVYAAGGTTDTAAPQPLNPALVTAVRFEQPGIEIGTERCFVLRSIRSAGDSRIESVASDPICVTPVDRFPPAAPQGLRAVVAEGAISLSWDANSEADLAGYVVLRGESADEKLQPLTPSPIAEAFYRDTTTRPGVHYVYAVIALDKASPANRSGESNRVEETAR